MIYDSISSNKNVVNGNAKGSSSYVHCDIDRGLKEVVGLWGSCKRNEREVTDSDCVTACQ